MQLSSIHEAILKSQVGGKVTLKVPAYHQSQTTLEYEDGLKAVRQPYRELVNMGYLTYESRHGSMEVYRLTKQATETMAYRAG